ncbi:MAG: hypothetical protein RH860_13775 [Cytophagales bacterium]
MKYLLTIICLVISLYHSFAQIQVNYDWGSSKETIKEAKSDILISVSDGLLKYKTKVLDKSAIQEYYFDQNQLIKVQYTLINSKDDLLTVWETFKQVEKSISTNYKTKSEDLGKRKLIEEDTKAEMKKIARGSSQHDIEWQDSLTKSELVVFSYALKPRTIIEITPLKNSKENSITSLNSSSKENPNQPDYTKKEKIIIKRGFGKFYFYQEQMLNNRELFSLTSTVPEAYNMMYKSNRNEIIANVLGAIGGFMFGYSLGQLFTVPGVKYNPTVGLVGLTFIGTSIRFDISGDSKRYKAVRLYNSKVK